MAIEYLAALPQMMPPPNARLLIAGACGGLGFALTEAALAAGIEVVGLDRQEALREIALPVSAHGIAFDATNEDSVAAAFAAVSDIWPQIDHVVNFVGLTKERVLLEDLAMAEWDEIVDGCLKSAFLIARQAAPLLRRGKNPTLVNTSSTFGAAIRHDGPYATAKAGVINLTRALALEWAPNICVNAIAPGIINTAFLHGGTGRQAKQTGVDQAAVLASIPLQRLGEASDITGLAHFLSSPAAGFITGQTVHANGGTWS